VCKDRKRKRLKGRGDKEGNKETEENDGA